VYADLSNPMFMESNNDIMSSNKKRKYSDGLNAASRKKSRSGEEIDGEFKVTLSRDELLCLTSDEFDNYVKLLEMRNSLSQEENRELRRQRRLIKNRESAQASRLRRKRYVEELEKTIDKLEHENTMLRNENEKIDGEKNILAEKLFNSQKEDQSKMIKLFFSGIYHLSRVMYQNENDKDRGRCTIRASGIMIVIFMFSVGILLGGKGTMSKELNNFEMKKHVEKKDKRSLIPFESHMESDYSLQAKYIGDCFESNIIQEPDYTSYTVDQLYPNINWKSNTNYIVCDKVSVLNPPERFCKSSEGPLFLSLLFPKDHLCRLPVKSWKWKTFSTNLYTK